MTEDTKDVLELLLEFVKEELDNYEHALGTLENPYPAIKEIDELKDIKEALESFNHAEDLETGEEYRERAIYHLESAVQVLGEWSEKEGIRGDLQSVLVAEIHNIDKIGNELNDIKIS